MDREYQILIVDDINEEFERYRNILEPYTCLHLLYAKNGTEALESISKSRPDIIFLDQYFYADNIGKENLLFEFNGQIVKHESDDMIAMEHEKNQGLYIIRKIKEEGFDGKVVFVTAHADDTSVGEKALELGASDYTSKDRLDNKTQFVQLLENELFIRLVTLEEKIESILKNYYDNPPEKNLLVKKLVETAKAKRRRGLLFVETVLKQIKSEHTPLTFRNLLDTIKATSEKKDWQYEPVNPKELLELTLSKYANLKSYNAEKWDYEGTNGVRYGYMYRNGDELLFLRIVHPGFACEIHETDVKGKSPESKGYFTLIDSYEYKLESNNDPYWLGNHIIAYLEKGNDTQLIRDYVQDNAPLKGNVIKEILENIKELLNSSESHGAISTESIYIKKPMHDLSGDTSGSLSNKENIVITISDYPLYNLLNEEGRNVIKGLSPKDKKARDVQALGFIGNYLFFGEYAMIGSVSSQNLFFSFLEQCSNGIWDLNQDIPELAVNVQYFNNGPYMSKLEREFAHYLKERLCQNETKALVYFNTVVRLGRRPVSKVETIAIKNEVDVLVVKPDRIFWLDIKGREFLKDMVRTGYINKLNTIIGNLKGLFTKCMGMGISKDIITGYIVLRDSLYNECKHSIQQTEKDNTRSFSDIIDEIKHKKDIPDNSGINLDEFRNKFENLKVFYKRYESPYEDSVDFIEDYGNITIARRKRDNIIADLNCSEKPYYIRRYSLDHSYDSILDVPELVNIINSANKENSLIGKLPCAYTLFPNKIFFIDSQNERSTPFVNYGTAERTGVNHDLRWIYKVYEKPGKDFEGPLLLKDCVENIAEDERKKLLYHYLKAVVDLQKIEYGFDGNLLKVFKEKNTYVGVVEPILNRKIEANDVLSIIIILDPDRNILQTYKDEITASQENLESTVKTFVDTLSSKTESDNLLTEMKKGFKEISEDIVKIKMNNKISPETKDEMPEKLEGTITSIKYSVMVESDGRNYTAELNSSMNVTVGESIYAYATVGNDLVIFPNQKRAATNANRQSVVIKSLPKLEKGVIKCKNENYSFKIHCLTKENRNKLRDKSKVSFIESNGKTAKKIEVL